MAGLELQHIHKSFGNTSVLKDVSLSVQDGEFVVLLGPSGCGKSTLLRIIAGLEPQTKGTVSIQGSSVDHLAPRDRDIAMVFQQYALYPHLTVRENLAFGLKMRKEEDSVVHSRIQEAAELLDIHTLLDRRPKELSGGQRQRVAMGRALVRQPTLFLFDEPLSNLDARLRTSTRVELKKLHQRLGVTMIYVTHDQVEAMTLGQRIVILDHGEIRQIGTPQDIYDTPANPFVAEFIGSPPMNLFEGQLTLTNTGCQFKQGDWNIDLPAPATSRQDSSPLSATLGIRPEAIQIHSSTAPGFSVEGTVDLLEHLGADTLMYVHIHPQPGDSVTLFFPLAHLHVFVDHQRIDLFHQ
jgi:ABC-type sugar transport system ATPase subunit